MFSISDIIDFAIQIEHNGEKVYRTVKKKDSNPSLFALLQWMADEELLHAEWFSELKGKVKTTTDNPQIAEMGKALLSEVLGDQSFSLKDVDLSSIEQVKTLLLLSVEFEKDTIIFYEMLRHFIEDETERKHLDTIIEEENRHVQKLKEFLDKDAVLPTSH